ncbi:MAG: LysR family transcriptional regulator [Myxococcales bacterium]|nr:LysR family transcriptional regulator [Myxococcales bacterium]
MDWQAVTFDWNRARAFLVTAEEGSFTAAARALNLTQPTLGRQVTGLEEQLGVTLFERVGNSLELTATGVELLEHVRAMAAAANQLSLTAAGQSAAIDGTVRLAASEVFSAFILPPVVARLRREYPGIEVEIVAANTGSDLLRREADIALRNFRPQEPSLLARKLGEHRAWLYATPAYLRRIGNPKSAEALARRVEFVDFDRSGRMAQVLSRIGLQLDPENLPIRCENQLVQWELVKQGVCVGVMMEEVGEAEPRVRRVLPELGAAFIFPTYLTCHRELATSRRIRVVFDLLAQLLTNQLFTNESLTNE